MDTAAPDVFFTEGRDRSRTRHQSALALCRACPVRDKCLEYALDLERDGHRVWGIWGGLTEPDRRRLSRYAS